MKRIVLRLVDLIKKGEITFTIKGISKRILSKTKTFGLKRDLRIPFPIPDAKIDIAISHFRKGVHRSGFPPYVLRTDTCFCDAKV